MKFKFIIFILAACIIVITVGYATNSSAQQSDDRIQLIATIIGKDGKPFSGIHLIVFKVLNKESVVQEIREGSVVGPTGKSDKNGRLAISLPKGFLKSGDDFTFGTENSWLIKNDSPVVFTLPKEIKNNKVILGDVYLNP